MYLEILSELPVYENYKEFSDKPSYNRPIIIYSVAKMWQKKVDIVTSSPILAQRDRQKFQGFFTDLKLSVIDNVNIKEDAEQPYKADVVYGTVGTFTTDILQSEFKMIPKVGRGDRPFEFVIVDEVDSMFIDDGGQFNYLSHNMASSGLRHLEL